MLCTRLSRLLTLALRDLSRQMTWQRQLAVLPAMWPQKSWKASLTAKKSTTGALVSFSISCSVDFLHFIVKVTKSYSRWSEIASSLSRRPTGTISQTQQKIFCAGYSLQSQTRDWLPSRFSSIHGWQLTVIQQTIWWRSRRRFRPTVLGRSWRGQEQPLCFLIELLGWRKGSFDWAYKKWPKPKVVSQWNLR